MAADKGRPGRRENAGWYMALIAIILAGLVVWGVLTLRIDVFSEALKGEKAVAMLLVVDDGERPLCTEVLFYHPVSDGAALVDIPLETGALIASIDRVSRLETVYNPEDLTPYSEAIGGLLGRSVDFTLRMGAQDFEAVVDLVGGIEVFIPNAIETQIDETLFRFPPGGVLLDGAKALSYLEYRPLGEAPVERTDREHRVMRALIGAFGERVKYLRSEDVFPHLTKRINTDLDTRSLSSFLAALGRVDVDRVVLQGVLGNRRILGGREVLFPYYDGKLIRDTVHRISESLAQPGNYTEGLATVRVEILNGTNVNGLASRTAQLYQSFGFRIASVANADRDDYSNTVVLDRKGSPDAARRVADVVRCDRVHVDVNDDRDQTVDVTIILGKDFDGRYVKE